MSRTMRPSPPPLEANDELATAVITAGWAVALVILLVLRDQLPASERWWIWTCLAGLVMGLFGLWYVPRVKRARTRAVGAVPRPTTREEPMSDLQGIADRVEIEALRGEFNDAVMMHDYDRLAALFTPDGVVRIPYIGSESVSRAEIRAGVERLQGSLDYFVQTTHPGMIQLDGDTASGRAYMSELLRFPDGRSELNYAIYHDRYRRTTDGWKFTERVYEVRYLDTTPLPGGVPPGPA